MTRALSYDEMMQAYPPIGQNGTAAHPMQQTLTPSLPDTMTYEEMAQTVLPPEQPPPLEQPRVERPTSGLTLPPDQQAQVDAAIANQPEAPSIMDYLTEAPRAAARGYGTATDELISGAGVQWELLSGGGPAYELQPILDKMAELDDFDAIYGDILRAAPESDEARQFHEQLTKQHEELKQSIARMEQQLEERGYKNEIKDSFLWRLGQTLKAIHETQYAATPSLQDSRWSVQAWVQER